MTRKRAGWEAFVAKMPAVIRETLGTEPWEPPRDDFEGELQEVPLSEVDWVLDLPIWGWQGEPFQVTPNQVRADPQRYAVHFARAMWADLDDPIHLAERNGRWVVLDGYHRLLRAAVEGRKTIAAVMRR